jgi:hypothetical protein
MAKFLVVVIEKIRVLYEVEAETTGDIYSDFSLTGYPAKELSSVSDGFEIESVRDSD